MTLGARIEERRKAVSISQAELARRVGVRQSTINGLINGGARSSRSIVKIAQELWTTPAYLTGHVDDPDAEAVPPPTPTLQYVTLPVALPSEATLTRMFEGILAASPRLHGAELARELAKRLPTTLAALRGPLIEPQTDRSDAPPALPEAPETTRREPRRASRT